MRLALGTCVIVTFWRKRMCAGCQWEHMCGTVGWWGNVNSYIPDGLTRHKTFKRRSKDDKCIHAEYELYAPVLTSGECCYWLTLNGQVCELSFWKTCMPHWPSTSIVSYLSTVPFPSTRYLVCIQTEVIPDFPDRVMCAAWFRLFYLLSLIISKLLQGLFNVSNVF